MKKGFDLYYAGSQNKMCEQYLKDIGSHRLASQLNDRKIISDWMEGVEAGEITGKLFIDSGAYSAHTRGVELDVDEYIEYLNINDEWIDIYAQVDKIPGVLGQPKTRKQLLEAPKLSWENYNYMRPKMKSPDKLLPIFHQGEEFHWLHQMLETTFDGKHIPYIGISPANDQPIKKKEVFIEKCFNIIKQSSNPDVKTHAFGMTTLNVLERYPFTSADSTSWIMCGANGSIMSKYGTISVSDGSDHTNKHISNMPEQAQKEVKRYVKEHGFTMEELAADYKQRIKFNIVYLNEWAENYEYKPSKVLRKALF